MMGSLFDSPDTPDSLTGMHDPAKAHSSRPSLPTPQRTRWQPLRLGLVELFRYDSEEFWFRDGHLLLRGNNGTGKSKVLSLVLPFLLDAQLKSSRIEPDGDPGKKMAWNLLLGTYPRRTGYTWIEFGRRDADGTPHFLTLGAGLQAVEGRAQVESWFFLLEATGERPAPRIGQDLWLVNARRQVHARDKLREAIDGRGQVFETAQAYRLAVDQRLFGLGTERYGALMDTLIQLRQPQLSKKPDEGVLSNALTEALPPLSPDLLGDVAEALQRLEEDRLELEGHEALERAVRQFQRRYGQYAATLSRRQARLLRQAQTEFDQASRASTEARDHLQTSRQQETAAVAAFDQVELAVHASRARLDTLRADPTMQDANRLATAERDAQARERATQDTQRGLDALDHRITQEAAETERLARQLHDLRQDRDQARLEARRQAQGLGLEAEQAAHPLFVLDDEALATLAAPAFDAAGEQLRQAVADRREAIVRLMQRHEALRQAQWQQQEHQRRRDDNQAETDDAAERSAHADEAVEQQAQHLIEAWHDHLHGLQCLQLPPDEREATLVALADWVREPLEAAPPRRGLQDAHLRALQALSTQQATLDQTARTLAETRDRLAQERHRLEAGEEVTPLAPAWRDPGSRVNRQGAPLWQLIEFNDPVPDNARAGLEAALEASGLLDAWVSPDGHLQHGPERDGTPWQDSQVLARADAPVVPRARSLAGWVRVAQVSAGEWPVAAEVVDRVIGSIACGQDDPGDVVAWVAPDGRFRLGTLVGAHTKTTACYLGFAARLAARQRRLTEIANELRQLAVLQQVHAQQVHQLAQNRAQADGEWRSAPEDGALRKAHLEAQTSAHTLAAARTRLQAAETRCRTARQEVDAARQVLHDDATDLRLPEGAEALAALSEPLEQLARSHSVLVGVLQAARLLHPEHQRQHDRQAHTALDRAERQTQWSLQRQEAEEARSRWETLRDTVGVEVEALRRQIASAEQQVQAQDRALREANQTRQQAGEARAIAGTRAETTELAFVRSTDARAAAVAQFQRFAGTGLLAVALPALPQPQAGQPWTIDPALTLARAAECDLSEVRDDDDTRDRLQRQISQALTELQGALTALGHRAQAESSDFGLVVSVLHQNRAERPDQLAARLADEIAQRRELLTASEREVLENHLQAEIAAEVQKLLQAAERQVTAINTELHKRPTSTGVRYRLRWEPLVEGSEGAPVGLEAARRHLLHTNADLWSAADRRVIGSLLQQRILAERARAEAAGTGSLLEQLARALDYRRWHVFRVQRWQDGQWRKLSGPASSGERALGLTVPLFAAVASFYGRDAQARAPRLVLLDEAFAGIDDAARAHCMALIHEFDLDFVITSEREWACYAELPGVSICQLLRREGVDAVLVSRWSWDGRAKRRENDPDRRFEPAEA
jgi:uncharacterized protein (TIGR02680 family)